jgi:DNA-binding beta-propeller fold protein YncE
MRTRIAQRAVTVLALLAGGLTACSDGGNPDDGVPNTQTEQPGVLRTITAWAGPTDAGGPGYRDGTGSAARFLGPGRVAVANDGSVYVADGGARLRRIDATGQVTTVLDVGTEPLTMEVDGRRHTLGFPGAMVAAPAGGVFVALERAVRTPAGFLAPDKSWAVLHIAPGAPPRLVALAPEQGVALNASALAIDREGRLYVATECAIWRTSAEAPGSTNPRVVQSLYQTEPASPGAGCIPYSGQGITRMAVDANDRVLFTLRQGDVKRLESDGRVTTLGHTSAGAECGMAVDPRGGLLLTGGSSVLLRLDDAGRESTVAGVQHEPGSADGNAQAARFHSLCGVAIDGQGRIVLVDGGNHTIRRIELDGSVVTIAGRPLQVGFADGVGKDAYFSGNVIIGPGGGANILVADAGNAALREVDAAQRVRTLAGGPGTGTYPPTSSPDGPTTSPYFSFLISALRAPDGSVWMVDGNRVRRWGTDGIMRTVATPSLDSPLLALDRSGDVIVAWSTSSFFGTTNHLERHSTRNPQAAPERLAIVQPNGSSPIRGLCALPDGTFVFTQAYAVFHRAADGTASLLAGSQAGSQDGPATAARFGLLTGLACDASGGIYVADSGNNTVRYIDAQRNVRTVLGTPGVAGHRADALPGELDTPRSLVLVPGGLVVGSRHGVVRAGF